MKKLFLGVCLLVIMGVTFACGKENVHEPETTANYDNVKYDDQFEIHLPDETIVFNAEYTANKRFKVDDEDSNSSEHRYLGLDDEVNAVVTDDGILCEICICDEDIVTYRGISVGDDVVKLEQAYEDEIYANFYLDYVIKNDENGNPVEYVYCSLHTLEEYDGTHGLHWGEYIHYKYLIRDGKVVAIELSDDFH